MGLMGLRRGVRVLGLRRAQGALDLPVFSQRLAHAQSFLRFSTLP